MQKIFGLQLKRYCIRAEESYISKSAEIFRRFGQNNPHEGLSLILLSHGSRQEHLLAGIDHIQTMITCTGLEDFLSHRFPIDKIYKVVEGTVSGEN